MTILDMVIHLSLIEKILTTKQTTVLDLRGHILRIHIRMRLKNVVGHVAGVLTDEDIGARSTFHPPEIRWNREDVERKKVVVVVKHSFHVEIRVF